MNFAEKHPKLTNFGINAKAFCIKAHLNYLALALLVYGLKAALYFIIAFIPCNYVMFNMKIDTLIPFVPYFYFFYISYYIVPEIFLWILSFYDKRKFFNLIVGVVIANILCCICFLIQNVKMDRAQYEAIVEPFDSLSKVTNFREFWYFAIRFQYHSDSTALNCFPSLHATFGMMLALVGIPLSKKEKHFPLWARIVSIVFGFGIILSTFFIKQHYFIDAVAGMFLMVGTYFLARFIIDKYLLHKEKKKMMEEKEA